MNLVDTGPTENGLSDAVVKVINALNFGPSFRRLSLRRVITFLLCVAHDRVARPIASRKKWALTCMLAPDNTDIE